ncbi:hypothetical protein JQ557_10880 [Bradyrhizobium sp. U87765 SZCCT0131]|nr:MULTISPECIES: hypothetical protein [unclassified Bradyrhizobium]MBR1218495.1 hypothetical protein [Bradyrhizobium sp. U87765 SZCCT0131]MBR1260559.1 hypothetical protein [Bradyrhizobium sp. U87765 SZCCT0134]MBR1303993.1 hypothetical protein [Bradyrhizobium sp. U87765 SZCCT0110]MBR1319599.1 hypothetical protein [Bradyrhizobium sp. U87765 SZCCT0109]MBR1347924.1 hypothetical protein [Bradyrhizobium sp. U87765 SZCCT0048]
MSNSNDPAEIWRTYLAELEKGFNAFANQAMGSREFSRAMNQAGGATFGAQKTVGDLMERYLASMNLPSRAQLVNMGERLQAIEGQLAEIKSLLQRVHSDSATPASGLAATPRPPRTRQPPSASGGGSA